MAAPDVDVAVIGAGLSGLAAAVSAAGAGARVTVLDARSAIGGRARTESDGGFLVNEGPHALYLGGEAISILRSIGIDPAGASPSVAGAAVLGGAMHRLPVTPTSVLTTTVFGARGRLAFGRLMGGLGRLHPADLASTSVTEFLESRVTDARARRVAHALVRLATYVDDPDHLSADAAVIQLQRAARGVRYVDGGWQTIVDALQAVAADRRVTFRTGVKVRAIEQGGPGIVVHLDDGTSVDAASGIVAVGGPRIADEITGRRDTALSLIATDARPSLVAALDVGLAGPWPGSDTFALGIDEPIYLSVHAPVAALAPAGSALVSLVRYHRASDPLPDADTTRLLLESALARVVPDWRRQAMLVRYRHALQAMTAAPTAALGGLAGRAPVESAARPGVLVAGDWVGSTGLLADAALASGQAAGVRAAELAAKAERDGA